MKIIAADIGGTTVKGALIDGGKIVSRHSVVSEKYFTVGMEYAVYELIAGLLNNDSVGGEALYDCEQLCKSHDIDGIAICTAGDTDPYNGVIVYATDNIPGYSGTKLKYLVERKCKVRCSVINDVHSALLCEIKEGSLKGYSRAAMITLGTGVGGAFAIDGSIVFGEKFDAYRLGHYTLEKDGVLCTCGKRGCIEQYVSASALMKKCEDNGFNEGMPELFRRYAAGDALSKKIVDDYIFDLCRATDIIYEQTNFDVMAVGGGITGSGKLWFDDYKKRSGKNVVLAAHLNDAGVLGAVIWFKTLYKIS